MNTLVALQQQLIRARTAYVRSSRARTEQQERFRKGIRKTAFLIVFSVLLLAAIADLLSVFDVGWVVSWSIPLVGGFIVRRINRIHETTTALVQATTELSRTTSVLQQRLRGSLVASGHAHLANAHGETRVLRNRSYLGIFLRDTLIAQLIELIPVVDILPLYLGQVAKMLVNQGAAYREARRALIIHNESVLLVDQLEQFELASLELQFANAIAPRSAMRTPAAPQRSRSSAPVLRPAYGVTTP